jgi:SpoIID/LytB domain protein
VIPRIELPPAARGILSAEGSNFSKEFEGLLELVSPRGPIEVEEFLPEERTGVRTAERFGPRLFVVPFPDATVALLQSTSFRDYLEGVVPSEIFPGADDEALRAQAIVARTYAARYDGLSEAARPYLICASTDCQVYRGVSLKKSPTSRAVRDTADLVLRTADGGLAQTYYHSICGGHTEPNSAVFGTRPQSYLAGSDDTEAGAVRPLITDEAVAAYLDAPATAYCGLASLTKKDRWRWTVDLDASKLDDVARSLGLVPPLTALRVSKRGVSGRVLELLLETPKKRRKVTGELVIRRLLGGLLSSLFLLEPGAEDGRIRSLRIRGAGYGHGVGLCQMGAIGRAERGLDFRAILEAYYPGTSLVPLKEAVVK